MPASAFITVSGVAALLLSSHSMSCRGMPVQAQMRWRISTCRVVSALPRRNDGITCVTGVSQPNFFWSTSRASISVVSALVLEAIMNNVSPSTDAGLPISRTPRPPANTTLPWSIRPMATPGTS